MRRIDLTGSSFGEWVVLSYSHTDKRGSLSWVCRCSCGTISEVSGNNLKSGKTTSCGCMKARKTADRSTTHGMSKTRVYKIWAGMIQRCTNQNRAAYKYYGGRGISICDRWRDFKNFFEDMGSPPSESHSLERVDNNGWYEPSNCKWATAEVQSRNNRNCKLNKDQVLFIKKELDSGKTIAETARVFDVSESLVRAIRNKEVWDDV